MSIHLQVPNSDKLALCGAENIKTTPYLWRNECKRCKIISAVKTNRYSTIKIYANYKWHYFKKKSIHRRININTTTLFCGRKLNNIDLIAVTTLESFVTCKSCIKQSTLKNIINISWKSLYEKDTSSTN